MSCPSPTRSPIPPIYQAADSTESYIFAAERGNFTSRVSGALLQGLKEAWDGVSGHGFPGVWATRFRWGRQRRATPLNIMRMFYIADTMEEAIKDARDGINAHYEVTFGLSRNWGRSGAIARGEEITAEQMNMEWFEFAMEKDVILVGTPETVAEKD